ncbi:MAG: hypothetical protein QOG79_5501 [Mycobacterium sp.]|jgi:FtsZ-interacting cell division protein ZipA|nr:hypothetical protein [Mycobacterium sp.]MDT5195684.1 hypothetical protein [Mycobacterium sp.]MDT5241866.1 hypothetical protein [Mycobacterium sp.]MDT5286109.1 hypothetical protein [Mycobacterium sp.]MDT5302259.1 hypothetical protein [Mycobacterium sp.]
MATSTIIAVVLVAVAAVLILTALGFVLVHKRTDRRRVEAGDIRHRAAEQSHEVGQREALAEETAAKARIAQAEADAKTAHASGLQHQAQARRSDAATARDDVNQEYRRADTIDPDAQNGDAPAQDTPARETRQGTPADTQSAQAMPRSG